MAKWWIPERWAFVDALPKTSVGKFDKVSLRAMYGEGNLCIESPESPESPGVETTGVETT